MSDDAELKPYGYAPGNYMSACLACKKQMVGVDKRAWRCKSCAEIELTAAKARAVQS